MRRVDACVLVCDDCEKRANALRLAVVELQRGPKAPLRVETVRTVYPEGWAEQMALPDAVDPGVVRNADVFNETAKQRATRTRIPQPCYRCEECAPKHVSAKDLGTAADAIGADGKLVQ